MSLSFLVPVFLLGLAGIAVPVVVHLTRRRRRDVVAFPSLMFLRRIPFREQRRRRLRNRVLLAMRVLALSLMAVAFARPFLDRATPRSGAAGGPGEVVVLLDRSYSMGAGDQWAAALREVRSVLDGLGPLDRASLVVFDAGAAVAVRSTPDPGEARSVLDTLRVGWSVTRVGPALRAARTILEESPLPGGEVVIVSDFRSGAWRGDGQVSLPPGTRLTLLPVGADIPENLRVADISLARRSASGRDRVVVSARVAREGGSETADVPVSLAVDGQDLQLRTAAVPPNGTVTVTFDPFTVSRPHTRGTVRIPGDGLPADDERHFVVSPDAAISVLLVDGSDTGSDLYLRSALEVSREGRFRLTRSARSGLAGVELAPYDVVILNGVPVDGAAAERLAGYADSGGGVLLVAGGRGRWPASAEEVLPGGLGPPEDRFEGRGGRLGYLDYDHPVFETFSGPRSGDFTSARFFRVRGFSPAEGGRVLARYDDGAVALAERRWGSGTVMIWTSTLDASWNDLALQPVYLPFVHRLVEHLSGRARPAPWFTAGQVLDLGDPDALESAGLASPADALLQEPGPRVVVSPSGRSWTPSRDGPDRYLLLEERGFYTVRPPGTDPARPFTIAVNVDLAESRLERIDPEEIRARLTPAAGALGGHRLVQTDALRREDRERRQSLWRWILLAAFALLVVETAVSNRVSGTEGTARRHAGVGG